MKKFALGLVLLYGCVLLAGCGGEAVPDSVPDEAVTDATSAEATEEMTEDTTEQTIAETTEATAGKVAGEDEMVTPEEVVEDGMTPVYADALNDGSYAVTVKSSSSMFTVTDCTLTVQDGAMTAEMTMSGTGYLYLFMGTGEEAAAASEDSYIPFTETDGVHTFTVPVEALDAGIPCAAFSKRKELWYDRTLLFRADSLPMEAFKEGSFATVESLGLADGEYTVEVTLEGGSGKAKVQSPAKLTVADGKAVAEIIWGSNNYDYMVVDGQKYDPVSMEENSVFAIPVSGFDYRMAVSADTTAMSTPHEIEYTLYFDSATIAQ